MKNLIKIVCAVLCAAMMIILFPSNRAQAQTAYETIVSRADEPNIALSMGVIADSQFQGGMTTDYIMMALERFAAINPDYDGIAMAGDIVYMPEVTESYASAEEAKQAILASGNADVYDRLLSAMSYEKAEGKPYVYGMGNHEIPLHSKDPYVIEAAKMIWQEKMYSNESLENVLRMDTKINGYHFVTAAPKDDTNNMLENEEWLRETINTAIAEDANKPVFVLFHEPIQNTTYGSRRDATCYSEEFVDFLKTKPQVVVLTGHTHYATNDPQMIWQDGFTQVSMGCTGGSMGAHYAKNPNGNEANYIEVTDRNVVYIYRMDASMGTYIGNPWILDIPAMVADAADGEKDTSIWKYTDARRTGAVAPTFASDDTITMIKSTPNDATIQFPAATIETADEEVIGYRIQVIETKGSKQIQDVIISSDYYQSYKADTYTQTITGLSDDREYTVKVSAICPWEIESKPLAVVINEGVGISIGVTAWICIAMGVVFILTAIAVVIAVRVRKEKQFNGVS